MLPRLALPVALLAAAAAAQAPAPTAAQSKPAHWAFVAPVRPPVPAVRNTSWPKNDIDRFVLARLEQLGIAPSPEAERHELLRRVTFDLTGLPPTVAELDAFLADQTPDAYERVVDRLLATPAAAEESARLWLDLARYADTHGMETDNERALWRWRDWVIDAYLHNVPYDRFVQEQLAGDLLPAASLEQRIATGFNRCNPSSDEGGLIPEEYLVRYAQNRTDTFGTICLGLTVGCAQCHDHKYDPLPQRDYYRLFAYFASFDENGNDGGGLAPVPAIRAPRPQEREQLARLQAAVAEARAALAALPAPKPTEAAAAAVTLSPWLSLGPDADDRGVDVRAKERNGRTWIAHADYRDAEVHALSDTVGFTWLRRTLTAPTARTLHLDLGSDDGVKLFVDGEQRLAHRIQRAAARGQEHLELDVTAGEHELLLQIENTGGPAGFAFEIAADEHVVLTGEQRAGRTKVVAAEAARAAYEATLPLCMVSQDLATPRPVHVLRVGRYDQKGERVAPGTPAFLPPLPSDAPQDRRALAAWLFEPGQPLTARVEVNRAWLRHFGRGLVATPHDFGARGSRPSHEELLDWLAVEFAAHGYDQRALHRLLVTSATYRQSAHGRPDLAATDPGNVWLARMSRLRLPAEAIRDQALAVAGLLVADVGGPSVRPYHPPGVWEAVAFPGSNTEHYVRGDGSALYRRSLYTFWKRTAPPALLATLDAPSREQCTVERPSTNTPLQALALLSDEGCVEAARAFAARLLGAPGDDNARTARAFCELLQRAPTPREAAILADALAAQRAVFADDAVAAAQLVRVGQSAPPAGVDGRELAAFTMLTNLLLNLDEALHR
jgi:hypothetical protein